MKKIVLFGVLALLSVFAVLPASADDVSALSFQRLAVAVGGNYQWFDGPSVPAAPEEFSVGVYAAYALTAPADGSRAPAVALVGSMERGFDNEFWQTKLGIRVTLFDGGR